MLDVAELGVLAEKMPVSLDIACSSSCALELAPNLCPRRNLAETPMVCPLSVNGGKEQVLSLGKVTYSTELKGCLWLSPSHPDG